jgi:hypothetical protein
VVGCVPGVYVFAGSVTPDDDDGSGDSVMAVTPDTSGGPNVAAPYKATFLPPGTYTVAYTCNADKDNPTTDDSASVIFAADTKAATVQTNLITTVNFGPLPTP